MANINYPPIRRSRLLIHWLAIAMLLAVPAVDSPWARWLACGILGAQVASNLGLRSLFRQNLQGLPNLASPPVTPDPRQAPGVSVIVPARDEERAIETAVRSMLRLNYPSLDIVAIDDHSTDDTPNILDRLAQEDSRLRVLHDPSLPGGWQGKANAVWQGVAMARHDSAWLLLTDADAVFEPESLSNALAIAERDHLDYLTCVVFLENATIWEEMLMPSVWSALVINARPGRLDDDRSLPIGIGPFILVKRDLYLRSGGHAAIANQQPEDTFLAAVIRDAGGRMGVAVANDQVRVRIYAGLRGMATALVRKMRIQNRHQPGFLELRLAYTLLQEVLPLPMVLVAGVTIATGAPNPVSWIGFGLTALAAFTSWAASVSAFRAVATQRPHLEWLHPLAGLIRASLTVQAWREEILGKRLIWRDRDIAASEGENARPA